MIPAHRSRQPAQVIALFALGLIALTAMVGVVIDGGTLYVQRRTAQNAADAAALAGTRALQIATLASSGNVGDAISCYLTNNSFGITPTATAYFVGTSGTNNLGSIGLTSGCSGSPSTTIPTGASGVHVDVTIGPYNTNLVQVIGIRQLTAQASATAQVGVLGIPNPDITPLAGCGPDMLMDPQHPTPSENILNPDGTIDLTDYAGHDYILEGSQTAQDSTSSCPAWNGGSSSWKGRINISGITGTLTPPMPDVPVDTGTSFVDTVSSICISVYGSAGDPTNKDATDSICYLLVPIAMPPNPANGANIVTLACFKVYDGGNGGQKWRGILSPITTNTCNYGVYPPVWTYGNTFSETQVMLTK
jgi:Flp pilus assembly protein TadG